MDVSITNNRKNRIHPQMFALWLAFASIFMMFAALTSAYVVRQAAGMWLEFPLPHIFKISTAVILISSIVLHIAFNNFNNGNEIRYKLLLTLGLILGLVFVVLQYNGWQALYEMGVPLDINPSASFVYVISGFPCFTCFRWHYSIDHSSYFCLFSAF